MEEKKIKLDSWIYGQETELSQKEIENKLFEFEKIGSTNNINVFYEFLNCAIQVNEELATLYESFAIHLSDAAQRLFKENFGGFIKGFNKTPNKRDYLKLHFGSFYIDPELLISERQNRRNISKNLGYVHGLNQIDFCIYDFICPDASYKPSLSLLGIEYYDLNQLKSNDIINGKRGEFPLTIKDFYKQFGPYINRFNEIVKGYAQFLMATEIQKMLNDLENNKIPENLIKPEIDIDEKNELIRIGYKKPDENSILSVPQTALLIDYLEENKILFTNHLGKSKTSKIFSILTKHSNNTLRQNLDINRIDEIKNQSENGKQEQYGNLKKIKEALQNIVSIIDKEIENKEKL